MTLRSFQKGSRNRDFATAVSVAALLFGVGHYVDAFEQIHALTRKFEDWELDELVLLLLSLPLPVAWLAYRRSQEAIRETTRRMEVERTLAHSHKLESLGTLASGFAHEINNQLLPVTTMAEMVRDRMPESHPDRRKMDLIVAGAANARETVSKITVFSRAPEDLSNVCDVTDVCRATEDVLRVSCPANAQLNFTVDGGIGSIDMAEGDLQGIIVNLFSNAIDALGGDLGEVSVAVCEMELDEKHKLQNLSAGQYARLTVRDTGAGMEPEIIERIFDPFFTTKIVGKGVGLGLAVARREVRQTGGDIRVESIPGQGTTITVDLPLFQGSDAMEHNRQAIA